MFPDRRTKPWLRTPGLIIVAVVYVLGVVVTALATWATFKYVAPPSRLIEAAFVAVVLIIVGLLLIRRRRSEPGQNAARHAPTSWVVGIAAAVAASVLMLAPRIPSDAVSMPIFLLVEAAAVITITVWSRRPGWGDRQILALAAGALFAYAWHAFTTTPAFDTAPMVVVRISNVVFAALALIAVVIAARRIATADKLEKRGAHSGLLSAGPAIR